MKFVDFFSGVGGERRGMELAGHECMGFCEFDKYARAAYLSMHCMTQEQRDKLSELDKPQRIKEIWKDEQKYANGEWYSTDITRLHAGDIPRADCWIFSAPCQSFSKNGSRKGLDGQSGLVREIFRLLGEVREEDRPEWLVYENVVGMLSSSKGFDFLWILCEMDRGGYDAEWQILCSQSFGLPQKRERVYVVGHSRKRGGRKVFPLEGEFVKGDIHGSIEIPIREAVKKGYSMASEVDAVNFGFMSSKLRRGRIGHNTAQTLDTSCNQGIIVVYDSPNDHTIEYNGLNVGIRQFTPRECFRLQGWTDEYFDRADLVCGDNKLYKLAGNGISVPVMKAVGERLSEEQTERR